HANEERTSTMHRRTALLFALGTLSLAPAVLWAGGDDQKVRAVFQSLQKALKAGDAATIWKLLDTESQEAAARNAKPLQGAYAKANANKKAQMEKALGVSGGELAKLTGEGFLKTKRFLGKYNEVPGSKIDRVVVEGDRATLHYIEEDGDKESFRLARQGKEWKLAVPIPAGGQP